MCRCSSNVLLLKTFSNPARDMKTDSSLDQIDATFQAQPTLVLVATYNEARNIRRLVEQLIGLQTNLDILIIDDNSPDGTGKIIDVLTKQYSRVFAIHRDKRKGLAPALCEGFRWAVVHGYGRTLNLDADFSHDPKDILRLCSASTQSHLVIGSRYIHGVRVLDWPASRLALSLIAGFYVRTLTGMCFHDPTSGFRCFRQEALCAVLKEGLLSTGFSFHIEALHRIWRAGLCVSEVPICFRNRRGGRSKLNSQIIREAIWVTMRLSLKGFHRVRSAGCDKNPLMAYRPIQSK
jgi:dolichol-phosphate mannosyltransferase